MSIDVAVEAHQPDTTPAAVPATTITYGPRISSALIFHERADYYRREVGVDPFERKAALEADRPTIERLMKQFRNDKTFDDEFLNDVWQEHLQALGILTKDEQQQKDEFSLVKARTAKEDLRASGLSDAARFGFCKRRSCKNGKVQRLLLRGFCPDCRGVAVKQTVAEGGVFDATAPGCIRADSDEMKTSLKVTISKKKIHPEVLKLTASEKQTRVLAAKKNNPTASVRDIAEQTQVPKSTVNDILKNHQVVTHS